MLMLAIATNILKTAFVLLGQIYCLASLNQLNTLIYTNKTNLNKLKQIEIAI